MEKWYEKKNLGIPVTILCVMAYLIGYLLSTYLGSGIFVALIFAAAVFTLQFDDKVKNAVKQAYIIGIIVNVIELGFSLLEKFIDLVTPDGYNYSNVYNYNLEDLNNLNAFQKALQYIYKYGKIIVDAAVVVIFMVLIIKALRRKETKFSFVSNILGETMPMAGQVYQQPVQQMYQQARPQGQPAGKPEQPVNSGVTCPKCGKVNQPGAGFCASCGAKLQ